MAWKTQHSQGTGEGKRNREAINDPLDEFEQMDGGTRDKDRL